MSGRLDPVGVHAAESRNLSSIATKCPAHLASQVAEQLRGAYSISSRTIPLAASMSGSISATGSL